MGLPTVVTQLSVQDIRFPTSLEGDGSDAVNVDPDYSCPYVTVHTDGDLEGYGITFTVGRGNEIVVLAIEAYSRLVVGRKLLDIFNHFGQFWEELCSESQLRWLGPEKGVVHLAVAAIMNALWDLWAKMEKKPLWKLLVDMDPERLLSTLDFRYISDAITKEEALDILKKGRVGKEKREAEILEKGYPAYTTSAGWLGYSDEKIVRLCREALAEGYTRFKVKVGGNQIDDLRRLSLVRKQIGDEKILLTDANQRWDVYEAIERMKPMAKYNVTWIEEPTNPDDIMGHLAISKALAPYGIGVATGEHCQNRVMFKQFLQAGAMQFCQIDSCRLGGPNEIITVYLMAAKYGVPVCPHAGGVGLCELVQHLQMFDYISVSGSMENRVIEYVDHLHEHFINPVVMRNSSYMAPMAPGYSTEMKKESLQEFMFPIGKRWQKLFESGEYEKPEERKNQT